MWNPKEIIKKSLKYMQKLKHQSFLGNGYFSTYHGTQNAFSLINLSLITGHLEKSGTGLHHLEDKIMYKELQMQVNTYVVPDYNSVKIKTNNEKMQKFWNSSLDLNEGKTVVEDYKGINSDEIKGLYVQGENPAMSDPDLIH